MFDGHQNFAARRPKYIVLKENETFHTHTHTHLFYTNFFLKFLKFVKNTMSCFKFVPQYVPWLMISNNMESSLLWSLAHRPWLRELLNCFPFRPLVTSAKQPLYISSQAMFKPLHRKFDAKNLRITLFLHKFDAMSNTKTSFWERLGHTQLFMDPTWNYLLGHPKKK